MSENDMRGSIDITDKIDTSGLINVFIILNEMVEKHVIVRYALCGAMAAIHYSEPVNTRDVDVTIEMTTRKIIEDFSAIKEFLIRHDFPVVFDGECMVISGKPVQFIKAGDPLDIAATNDPTIIFEGNVSIPIWRVEYLIAKCLQVGRPKDRLRAVMLLETPHDDEQLNAIINRFGLRPQWDRLRAFLADS